MALNDKKTGFGFDMEEKFKKVTTKAQPEEVKAPDADEHAHARDYVYTHTHNEELLEPKQQERKQKRVQLLTYESLINRMDKYAAKRGVSRAAVFEAAVIAYLDKVDPVKPKK